VDFDQTSAVLPTLPEGFRYLYVDELSGSHSLKAAAKNSLGSWDIVWVVNGWMNGIAYGVQSERDCGARTSDIGSILLVSECYPLHL